MDKQLFDLILLLNQNGFKILSLEESAEFNSVWIVNKFEPVEGNILHNYLEGFNITDLCKSIHDSQLSSSVEKTVNLFYKQISDTNHTKFKFSNDYRWKMYV